MSRKSCPREAGLPEMSSLAISLVVTGVIVAGGVLGLVLQRVLPERYTMDKARDMIGGVVGQLTLLLVLVNGLLDLDGLRRLQHPADGAADACGARARVRRG